MNCCLLCWWQVGQTTHNSTNINFQKYLYFFTFYFFPAQLRSTFNSDLLIIDRQQNQTEKSTQIFQLVAKFHGPLNTGKKRPMEQADYLVHIARRWMFAFIIYILPSSFIRSRNPIYNYCLLTYGFFNWISNHLFLLAVFSAHFLVKTTVAINPSALNISNCFYNFKPLQFLYFRSYTLTNFRSFSMNSTTS